MVVNCHIWFVTSSEFVLFLGHTYITATWEFWQKFNLLEMNVGAGVLVDGLTCPLPFLIPPIPIINTPFGGFVLPLWGGAVCQTVPWSLPLAFRAIGPKWDTLSLFLLHQTCPLPHSPSFLMGCQSLSAWGRNLTCTFNSSLSGSCCISPKKLPL